MEKHCTYVQIFTVILLPLAGYLQCTEDFPLAGQSPVRMIPNQDVTLSSKCVCMGVLVVGMWRM